MNIVDRGSGRAVVVIPGIQGRWEWMKPGIDALAGHARVITFSLSDEPSSGATFDEGAGFGNYVEQVRGALDTSGVTSAAICGVSYGGLIAGAFAARYTERVSALILVSAIPPSWRPDARISFYLRAPWLLSPLFCLGSLRLYREIAAAEDTWWSGVTAACAAGTNAVRHIFHPGRMARRVHLFNSVFAKSGIDGRIQSEWARVKVPTLLVTGEESLERVVPPRITREYLSIWPHARVDTLVRSGHLGIITRPREFAALVSSFASASESESADDTTHISMAARQSGHHLTPTRE